MSLTSPFVPRPLDIPTTINVQSPRYLDDVSLSGSGSGSSSPGSPIIEVVPGAAYRPGSMVEGDPGARMVLEQTELVYDQLLAERQAKLHRRIEDKRRQFQEKIEELAKTDAQKATEFKRWSDAALLNMEKNCASEMRRLREDYEAKFARLERSLVQQCRHSMTQSRPAAVN